MTTAREQLLADFAAVLADPSGPGELIDINGKELRAIPQPVAWAPANNIEGVQVERERYFFLQGDLGFVPVPWQELRVNGRRWSVEAVPEKDQVIEIILVRYLS